MYTYFQQRYGLQPLIIEWTLSVISCIMLYKDEDHHVRLFGKVLKNDCDEEFIRTQEYVSDSLNVLLKVLIREKHQYKQEQDVTSYAESIKNGHINKYYRRQMIEQMCNIEDENEINGLIQNIISYR